MVDFSFIRLERTREKAFNTQESPFANKLYFGQIQLKPRDLKPYIQSTNLLGGVVLKDDTTVYLVDDRCNELDITAHFDFTDLPNQSDQFMFSLSDLPKDFGSDLVHLRVVTPFGNRVGFTEYFSNKFLVTNKQIGITTRYDYERIGLAPLNLRARNGSIFNNALHSIRLQIFLDRHIDQEVSENYFQITRGQNVNSRFDFADLIQWRAIGIDSFTWKRLKRAFYSGRCYIDFVRNYATDAFDFTGRVERSNISEQVFVTDPYEDDVLDVVDVFVITPAPVSITFDNTSVTFDNTQITFDNE